MGTRIRLTDGTIASLLRAAKLRVTHERMALMRVLAGERRPMSAQQIAAKLVRVGVDQATVYRSLRALVSAGVVRRVDLEHGHAHFEFVSGDDHHHLVCIECERIAKIPCTAIHQPLPRILARSGFATIERHALEFFGYCVSCHRKRRST